MARPQAGGVYQMRNGQYVLVLWIKGELMQYEVLSPPAVVSTAGITQYVGDRRTVTVDPFLENNKQLKDKAFFPDDKLPEDRGGGDAE